ncbi:MAG: hypothetical protein ACK6EB_28050, partial [Planctomyces sp.]
LAAQISCWKARATKILAYSRSFVVKKHPKRRPCRTDLGLESPSYMKFVSIRVHSWFNTTTLAKPLQGRSRAGKPELHSLVTIRVDSWFNPPFELP